MASRPASPASAASAATFPTDQADPAYTTQDVRRMLARLRSLWSQHAPHRPIYLEEELHEGVTVSQFCTDFILSQRNRRVVRGCRARRSRDATETEGGPPCA